MAIKDLIYKFEPVQLYLVLVLSICFFCLQLILSHITHGLTLLMASYHMLCNIVALTGSIIMMKQSHGSKYNDNKEYGKTKTYNPATANIGGKIASLNLSAEGHSLQNIKKRENKLKNTFGWARIEVLMMLIVCIFLVSLSFSLLLEALQTIVHIDHQDSMHLPVPVMILGFLGLILNGICYLLIGGYTKHQGSFLHMTSNGDVILNNRNFDTSKVHEQTPRSLSILSVVNSDVVDIAKFKKEKQNTIEMFRDVCSTVFVIICAAIIFMSNDAHTAKFIDPVISVFSCIVLVSLSYPYMKESCFILLQTIPGSIDIDIFGQNLGAKFPEIISYHDLHIWQLTSNKYVSTVHIKFKSQHLYTKIINDIKEFFLDQGITIVTIQPEFQDILSIASIECLVQCNANDCVEKVCCQLSKTDLLEITSSNNTLHSFHTQQNIQPSVTVLKENFILKKSHSFSNLDYSSSHDLECNSKNINDINDSVEHQNKILTI